MLIELGRLDALKDGCSGAALLHQSCATPGKGVRLPVSETPRPALRLVVDYLDAGVAAEPTEADSKLVVDANAVLSESIADELFKTIGRRHLEVGESGGCVEHDEFTEGDTLEIRRQSANLLPLKEAFGIVVAKAANHGT